LGFEAVVEVVEVVFVFAAPVVVVDPDGRVLVFEAPV
jgi:hypothetical protein